MKFFRYIFIVLLAVLTACSTPRPEGETEAEVLYKEAETLVDDGRYLLATEKLNTLRSKYPYSYFATHAELLLADVQFKQENYTEAAASYILFRDFHPKHERTDYVVFKIAESFYNQLPETFDRDLSAAHEAIRYYREMLRVFPKSSYSDSAQDKINRCEQMLRDKERYIADFYYKTEVYDAARFRYLDILKNFREPKLVTHAAIRVIESSAKMNETAACDSYFKTYQGRLDAEGREGLARALKACQKQ